MDSKETRETAARSGKARCLTFTSRKPRVTPPVHKDRSLLLIPAVISAVHPAVHRAALVLRLRPRLGNARRRLRPVQPHISRDRHHCRAAEILAVRAGEQAIGSACVNNCPLPRVTPATRIRLTSFLLPRSARVFTTRSAATRLRCGTQRPQKTRRRSRSAR